MKALLIDDDAQYSKSLINYLKDLQLPMSIEWIPHYDHGTLSGIQSGMFDVILVDICLDENDSTDDSGRSFAELIQKETRVPALLLSENLPRGPELFELIRTVRVGGAISKSIQVTSIAACLFHFYECRDIPNGVALFKFTETDGGVIADEEDQAVTCWSTIARRFARIAGEEGTCPDWEWARLFRSLIPPCVDKVSLREMAAGHSGTALFRATVSFGDSPVTDDLAFKFGRKDAIRSEQIRYDRHVGPLPDGVAAQLRWHTETRNLGALAYSWVGDRIEDGVALGGWHEGEGDRGKTRAIPRVTWQRRRNAVGKLFSTALDAWFRIYRSGGERPLDSRLLYYYCGRGGIWYEGMDLDRLRLPSAELNGDSRVESSGKVWRFFHNKEQLGDLGDPVAWATGKGAVLTYPTQCPTHGDMHVRNIYVLADDSPRLIDFGRTAMGHVWRDFAALEVSLRLTCICTTDLRKLKRVEDILCRAGGLSRYLDFRVFENEEDRELSELIRTVMKIRREAHDAAGQVGQDLEKQYFFAVMMHMLRYANGDADEVAGNKVKERRLVRMWHAHYGAAKAAEAAESILNP